MRHRHHRMRAPSARTVRRACVLGHTHFQHLAQPTRLRHTDRRSLLLGTALASTLLIGTVVTPTPADALVTCAADVGTGPTPIFRNVGDTIECVNTEARTGGSYAISLRTTGGGHAIDLSTVGTLSATNGGNAFTASIRTYNADSAITIDSNGDIDSTSTGGGTSIGIFTYTRQNNSSIDITHSGDIGASTSGFANSILARTRGVDSDISVVSSGDLTVHGRYISLGVYGLAQGANSSIDIVNTGDIEVTGVTFRQTAGVFGFAQSANSPINVVNTGSIKAIADTIHAYGVLARANGASSAITINNSGDIEAVVSSAGNAHGVRARANADDSAIIVINSGDLDATANLGDAYGVSARSNGATSSVNITNSGDLSATSTAANASGIFAQVYGAGSPLSIGNSGDVMVAAANYAFGISATTRNVGNDIDIDNSGDISVTGGTLAFGVRAFAYNPSSAVNVTNSGDISASDATNNVGVLAYAFGGGSPVTIVNSGDIAVGGGTQGGGLAGLAPNSSVRIENSGAVYAQGTNRAVGIYALSGAGATIVNSGDVSSSSLLAIDVDGAGTAAIFNAGLITGFVELTEQNDRFFNQNGGTFEARRMSLFRGGSDLFRNQNGSTVHALRDGGVDPSFIGLERFENRGLISTADGSTGDDFTISNTVDGTDLDFVASGNSRLAVDTSLGGPGSATDTFTIEGNVSGTTAVTISNTNNVGGELNSTGIPIVFATGETPNPNAFFLEQPVDAGFFDYDLFFVPTGSGFWELRSFAGAGAFVLPQLVTAAQDIWHQGSSTWFDRTADLRVLLNGGAAPAASAYGANGYGAAAPSSDFTPAVWVRGSGGWLDRDDSAKTSAYGRNYKFDLDRELETIDFQMGIDLGTRDFLSQGDILVFGVLGGFVHGDLDYDSIVREFDFDGGQVGAYATYLKGGLFVDTLLNVHLYELDANNALGFPNKLDGTTVGLRTDTGYRFGSFSGGVFLEPLATLEVTWADIDGFSRGGNTVRFDDDANVRGRLGLRTGTTTQAWEGTMMEPFIIGSLWGNLTDDNQATLVSRGSTFRFEDQLDDVWGEVSAGVNFFNISQTTAVFAKVDVTFGDDVSGIGGKAGMRVNW